jgi:hypothetical protein
MDLEDSNIILSLFLERLVDLGKQLLFYCKGDGARLYLKSSSLHFSHGWIFGVSLLGA